LSSSISSRSTKKDEPTISSLICLLKAIPIVLNGPDAMDSVENSVEIIAPSGNAVESLQGSKPDVASGILRVIHQRLVCKYS
jgi:hypothetical protein